ncbi:MAG: aminotransferase class III-fold pyridoxal phosphate-dependent enzyme [Candidatus Lokiarchaeota archaeon]|nr:aminotransferase class III-fold pyridoxal phosphate-dependent enzyme [Candidatus Lokiarchaeota archaeon]MBD3340379.1 aminotransferase class III-fold pyridoxal phosphate-dependent enzyme [Candidatus Lokiarchaeota archaeon]
MEYEEIQKRIAVIREQEVKGFSEEDLAKVRQKIREKTPKSKPLAEELSNLIPGGSQHQMALKDPYVVTMKRALGTRLWDVDDNEYIDYLMSAGACILGHNYPPFRDEIIKVLQDLSPDLYWNCVWENKAIKAIQKHVPSIERMMYFQSGTEADMAAIRIARVFTGNDKIIKFGGSYHGWSDQLNVDIHIPFSGTMESDGIPRGCYKDTISLPPNDLEALEENLKKWSAKRKGVAAVLVEPLGAESGALPVPPDFNKRLRELCDQYEVLLIFDEVVTGFRLDLGGAQKYFNVKPDLTVFGKILTQGYPSTGAVGGRADVMNVVTGDIDVGGKHASVSGTIRGNPLSVAATYWGIKFIEQENVIEKAAKAADDLVKKLNNLYEEHNRPYFAYNYKSIVHYETFSPLCMDIRNADNIAKAVYRKECVDNIATIMMSEGVITKYGNRAFTSFQHTPEDNDKFVEAMDVVLNMIPDY